MSTYRYQGDVSMLTYKHTGFLYTIYYILCTLYSVLFLGKEIGW